MDFEKCWIFPDLIESIFAAKPLNLFHLTFEELITLGVLLYSFGENPVCFCGDMDLIGCLGSSHHTVMY